MKINVSVGELVDKATILSIKIQKINDEKKLKNIKYEYELLKKALLSVGISEASKEFQSLKEVNLHLWEIEDQIRLKEKQQAFDAEFIQLARSVYFENDKRSQLKKEINLERGSEIVEEKEYVDYRSQ